MNDAQEYVRGSLAAHKQFQKQGVKVIGDPTPVYEFIVKHGHEFTGCELPNTYGHMMPKMCFQNAWQVACRSGGELVYYEGYATTGILPVHHAWNVNSNGEVLDFTWTPTVFRNVEIEWEYFGVGFDVSHRELREWWISKQTASVLFEITGQFGDDVLRYVVHPN